MHGEIRNKTSGGIIEEISEGIPNGITASFPKVISAGISTLK